MLLRESMLCSLIFHFPSSASPKWLPWSQKSFLEACPQSLGWLSFKAAQGCLSLTDGYLPSDSAAVGLFPLLRLFEANEKDGCIFLSKHRETLTCSPASSGGKRERNCYQGHLATEDVKHLWVFSTNMKKLFISHSFFPLFQKTFQNAERNCQNLCRMFYLYLCLSVAVLSIYKWPQFPDLFS